MKPWLALVLLLAPRLAGAQAPDPRLGLWKAAGGKGIVYLFEPKRLHVLTGAKHTFYYARYEEGQVVVWQGPTKAVWRTALGEGTLAVDKLVFRKLDTPPAELEIKPFTPGQGPAPAPNAKATIVAELAKRAAAPESPAADEESGRWLRHLVKDFG